VRFVLDAHVWIWSLLTPDRLAPSVRDVLVAPESALYLSAVSVWETLVLIRKRRLLVTSDDGLAWVKEALTRSPVREAPVSVDIALASEQLTIDHWDPADRFIAATARVLDATLITADERLLACPGVKLMSESGS
jgi:PIN domain nuclease of toxin-antitoxin system